MRRKIDIMVRNVRQWKNIKFRGKIKSPSISFTWSINYCKGKIIWHQISFLSPLIPKYPETPSRSYAHIRMHMTYGGGGLVAKSCPTLATPWAVACQAPLSMGFSRQEHRSGLPFPSPGNLPHPGIKPGSPAFADKFLTEWTEGSYNAWYVSPAHSPHRVHQLADKFGH